MHSQPPQTQICDVCSLPYPLPRTYHDLTLCRDCSEKLRVHPAFSPEGHNRLQNLGQARRLLASQVAHRDFLIRQVPQSTLARLRSVAVLRDLPMRTLILEALELYLISIDHILKGP